MFAQRSLWPTVTQLVVAASVFVCACSHITDATTSPPITNTSLELGDGTVITSESLGCSYRQSTGSSDELDLQLQYLSAPDSVAFAVYLTDPRPAKPFAATPREVKRFDFEAFVEKELYRSDRDLKGITVHLDELPPPSSLKPGDTVQLRGYLELEDLTLSAISGEGDSTVQILAGAVAIDCDAKFQEVQVLN